MFLLTKGQAKKGHPQGLGGRKYFGQGFSKKRGGRSQRIRRTIRVDLKMPEGKLKENSQPESCDLARPVLNWKKMEEKKKNPTTGDY